MHCLNLYDYSARYYEGALGRFTSVDPLAEKYYSISPYVYVANNPLKYVDYRGDSISVAGIQKYDSENGTSYLETIMNDLSAQTGLTYSVSATGMLVYNKDANGNAIVSKGANGNSLGSKTARDLMTGAIEHTDIVKTEMTNDENSASAVGGLRILLNPSQINGFINGANNLDSRTLGWGMTFMHETIHSKVGGGFSDRPYTTKDPGPVVTRMNMIRSELNAQGGNYGTRMTYPSIQLEHHGPKYLPFDLGSRTAILNGGEAPVARRHKYIKH